jgi:hypothetical protein
VPATGTPAELHDGLEGLGAQLLLSRVHSEARETLNRSGVAATIGDVHSHRRSLDSVRHYLAASSGALPPGRWSAWETNGPNS